MMEVGNEEDIHMQKVDDPNFQPYITAFNAQARAMHQADPGVKVIGPAGTNEYQWWNRDSLGMFLQATGNRKGTGQVDGVSVHFYKGNTWYDARNVAQYWLSPAGPWAAIQQQIAANDTRQLPLYVTEWNLGSSDMLGAFAQSGVMGEDYFVIHTASGWGLLYGTGESRPVDSPTPTYYAMALWGHMGDRVLPIQQSDDPGDVMSTYATSRSDGSVQILAINKQSVSHQIHIILNGASAAGHHLHIYSLVPAAGSVLDLDALYNGVEMPSPQQSLPGPQDGGIVSGSSITYTVPAYAAVILDLDGTGPGPTLVTRQISGLLSTTATASFPPLVVAEEGHVSGAIRDVGQTETLSATVQANYDIGTVLVDLEVHDSAGKKVFQQTQDVTLHAGTPVTVSQRYVVATSVAPGSYSYRIGVFGLNWTPNYTWNNSAGSFTVR
jgi:hypothetical protein